ncbi:flagellar hook-length control protein FliK [Pseudomonas sp. 8Z]|uniref:flagellar hook-length control protein FliK n=1 Tax=Pseudomonas sp. 8Z TaxID=2653166 RepID=UPI0035584149
MPDLLLQTSSEVKSKAKPPAKAPQPSNNEPSSFDKVYARERQVRSGERPAEANKATDSRASEKQDDSEAAVSDETVPLEVAADGKTLPTEEPTQDELDPLLAMAMSGMQAQPPQATEVPDGQGMLLANTEAVVETAEADPLAAADPADVMLGNMQLDSAKQVKVQPVVHENAKASSTSDSADFAEAMASMGKKLESTEEGREPSVEIGLDKAASEALDSLKESTQPNRPDQFVSKLNALTQAINQQSTGVQRVPMVPGQPVAMQQNGWTEAVVDKVMWMSSQNLKSAEIQLDPADLGRLEVRVHLSQDAAQVTFASPNAGVRDALEGQMHRLRDMFTQQGMNLADANVSDQSLNRGWQGQEQGDGGRGGARGNGLSAAGEDGSLSVTQDIRSERLSVGRGLVDYYA